MTTVLILAVNMQIADSSVDAYSQQCRLLTAVIIRTVNDAMTQITRGVKILTKLCNDSSLAFVQFLAKAVPPVEIFYKQQLRGLFKWLYIAAY